MAVRIVTDSSSELTDDEAARYGIEIVPLSVRFGDDEYVDREELSVDLFYELLDSSEELPETAAPSPGAFEQCFRSLLDEGATSIVCCNLSAALSATMQAAQAAAHAIDGADIRVVDSKTLSAGLGSICIDASVMAEAGASADEIVEAIADMSERTRVFGALDTLENLKKGGRIGSAAAVLGTVLSIKPLLDLSSGETAEAGRQRTRKRALAWLRDRVLQDGDVEKLTVTHGNAPDVDAFVDLLAEHFDRSEIRVGRIGPVIGTHGGPRVMGVAYRTSG